LSLTGFGSGIQLTPQLVFTILLPPLIFEAALHLQWAQFRREAPLVLSLAFVGTLVSAVVVAAGMHWLIGWSWLAALLFGSLIAATDPVSVIAMMKEQKAEQRLRFIMESESLVNDGAAAVLFGLCLAAIGGTSAGASGIGLSLLVTVIGGVACGLAVAGALLLLANRSDDHLVELTLTVLAAYGSFLLAEELKVSGVLATLAAGMLVGNWGPGRSLTEHGGEAMIRFWDFAAFLANSVIFILIGSREADQSLAAFALPAAAGIGMTLIGRALAIYPAAALFSRTRLRIGATTQHLLFWGGVRGALALALALAIPATLPERDALVSVAFAVVAFSIFVQATTLPLLLRRSGMCAPARQAGATVEDPV
ncbi:MAG: sodium:proton antiporter, partial [Sphingomonadales bacterium]|nr:sodium:proton antiporter [Sphingomonadales bacterium]